MGIVRLGHQKKILLAIKRVKDIRAGKRSISTQGSLDFTRLQPGQVSTIDKHVDFYCVCSDVLGLVLLIDFLYGSGHILRFPDT